ncbi:MAG TPA: ornithine cyclodeaminase family protein [Thermoanaerobaculia bacterium]|jgi:ornithine cyclodeaminase/alanine dehydrogenase-like protein (mu-crystallin family)
METLLLTGDDYAALVPMHDAIDAVERAFAAYDAGRVTAGLLSAHAERGAFHIKTAILGDRFAAKLNANFPDNAPLPTIQGLLVLFDTVSGAPLAVLDSMEVTTQRTAAATAVAAKHLARGDARSVTIYGCGQQAAAQLEALACVRTLGRVHAVDRDAARAEAFAARMRSKLGIDVVIGAAPADLVVTCTTAREPFLRREHLAAGAFVAAVGADNPQKSEIDPALMRDAAIVADVLEQSATIGDLRAAIAAGAMQREDVRAELGAVVSGRAAGRRGDDEVIVFDSTGAGFQDAAVAAVAYERAIAAGRGARLRFGRNG